jgi:hypothetical protein
MPNCIPNGEERAHQTQIRSVATAINLRRTLELVLLAISEQIHPAISEITGKVALIGELYHKEQQRKGYTGIIREKFAANSVY